MSRIVDNSNTLTAPRWAGDFGNREHLLPGGARLDAAQFTAEQVVPSGTAVGRTLAEQAAETGFGPADAADDEIYIIFNDVLDPAINPDIALYRHGGVVKINYLPVDFSTLAAGVQAAIRANYACTVGKD